MQIEVRSTDLVVTAEAIACQGFAAVCAHPVCVEAVLCRVSSVFNIYFYNVRLCENTGCKLKQQENKKFDKTGCKRKRRLRPVFLFLTFFLQSFWIRKLT